MSGEIAVPGARRVGARSFKARASSSFPSLTAEVDVAERVRAHGKFLWLGSAKWSLRGLTYGPFAPNSTGEFLPERTRMLSDFEQMHELGANAIRLYHLPSRQLLDDALAN